MERIKKNFSMESLPGPFKNGMDSLPAEDRDLVLGMCKEPGVRKKLEQICTKLKEGQTIKDIKMEANGMTLEIEGDRRTDFAIYTIDAKGNIIAFERSPSPIIERDHKVYFGDN